MKYSDHRRMNLCILRKNTRFQIESQKFSKDIFLASSTQLVYSGNLLEKDSKNAFMPSHDE